MGNVDGRVSSSRPAVKESFAIMDDMEAEGGRRGGGGGGGNENNEKAKYECNEQVWQLNTAIR